MPCHDHQPRRPRRPPRFRDRDRLREELREELLPRLPRPRDRLLRRASQAVSVAMVVVTTVDVTERSG